MRARRLSAIVLAGALAVAATAIAIRQVVLTDAGLPGSGGSTRVALIRMWDPGSLGSRDEAGWRPFVEGLLEAERKHELETEIVDLFPRRPPLGGFEPGSKADVDRLSARLQSGEFDLVLWPLGLTGPRFFDVVPQYPDTRFVFLDYCCARGAELGGAPECDCADVTRRPGRPSRRLPERPHGGPANTAPGSGSTRCLDHQRRAELPTTAGIGSKGSQRGCGAPFRAWRFAATTRSSTTTRRPARGSRTGRSTPAQASSSPRQWIAVWARSRPPAFAACGASRRGEDLSHLGPHILASASQRYDRLVELTVSWYLEGRLPPGGDVELGLVDDAVALVGINPDVPPLIRAKVAQEAARLRAQEVRQPG